MLQISRQSIQARASYSDFKKCCEKKKKEKKNTKKIRRTLKAHISGKAWRIQFKFGIGGSTPRGNSHRKFRVFLFREFWATDAWKRRFLYSCKVHTCLSHAKGFFFLGPHDTLPRVLILIVMNSRCKTRKLCAYWLTFCKGGTEPTMWSRTMPICYSHVQVHISPHA